MIGIDERRVTVEFLKDYKCGHKEGDVKKVNAQFAHALVEAGYVRLIEAKAPEVPHKDKMMRRVKVKNA